MDSRCLLAMLFVTTLSAVVLLVYMGIGGCLCPISLRVWRAGIAPRQLMKRAPSLASATDDMMAFIICATVRMAPLFVRLAELLDLKKYPLL